MDIGAIVVALIGLVFVGLMLLAVRKMASKKPHALEETASSEDLELEREALSSSPPPSEALLETPSLEPTERRFAASAKPMVRGLERTRNGFMARIHELLFRGGGIDASLVDELESILVTSDIGIRTAERLLSDLRDQVARHEVKDPEIVRARLKERIRAMVSLRAAAMTSSHGPTVLMVIGVNGVGKTTTIGKLAARLSREGKKVILAAGDTFRAAAVEQLEIWGERSGTEVVKGPDHGDPSAVVFEAIQRAQSVGADICIADTAGRLHTKVNLMEELKKLRRVMAKALPGAPHEVILVLDATTGQNAIAQAKQFKEAVDVTSIALTKLDGTAKGGVVVAICDDLKIPVRFVGIGEAIDDLRDFDPDEFVEALFERAPADREDSYLGARP